MNIDKVNLFLQRLIDDDNFCLTYTKYYEKIRMIAIRTADAHPIRVDYCERKVTENQLQALEVQARKTEEKREAWQDHLKIAKIKEDEFRYHEKMLIRMKKEVELERDVDRTETRLELGREMKERRKSRAKISDRIGKRKRPRSRTPSSGNSSKLPRRGLSPLSKKKLLEENR